MVSHVPRRWREFEELVVTRLARQMVANATRNAVVEHDDAYRFGILVHQLQMGYLNLMRAGLPGNVKQLNADSPHYYFP